MRHPTTPREAPRPVKPPFAGSPRERDALVYLQRELLPELERGHHDGAAHGVQRAVSLGSLETLRELPASQKHALLGTLESRMGRAARRPGPSVVVQLIGSLDLTPPESLARRHAVLPPR